MDLSLKVAVELLAFTQVNGLPGDSFGDFAAALQDYAGDARVRMAALVCFDALLPLGDQALQRLEGLLAGTGLDADGVIVHLSAFARHRPSGTALIG